MRYYKISKFLHDDDNLDDDNNNNDNDDSNSKAIAVPQVFSTKLKLEIGLWLIRKPCETRNRSVRHMDASPLNGIGHRYVI